MLDNRLACFKYHLCWLQLLISRHQLKTLCIIEININFIEINFVSFELRIVHKIKEEKVESQDYNSNSQDTSIIFNLITLKMAIHCDFEELFYYTTFLKVF